MGRTLFLVTNYTCDLHCKYCFYTIGIEARKQEYLKAQDAPIFAKKIRENDFSRVILTGGDPLSSTMKQETFKIISALKEEKLDVVINTSGAFLSKEDIKKLLELNIDRIDISLNSKYGYIHDEERGAFCDSINSITMLKGSGYNSISTATVITNLNAPFILESIEWIREELEVQDTGIQPVYWGNSYDYSRVIKVLEELKVFERQDYTRKYLQLCISVYRNEKLEISPHCLMGREIFVCDCLGNLTPCFHREDYQLGNLLSDSPHTINAYIKRFQRENEKLPTCFSRKCISLFNNDGNWR